MRKIVAGLFVSVDGVIEMPPESIDPFFDDEVVRLVEALTALKYLPGREISVAGSPTLVRSLLAEGLIDGLRLVVFPIVLGDGRRLFAGWRRRMSMRLLQSRTLANGVVSFVYEPAR